MKKWHANWSNRNARSDETFLWLGTIFISNYVICSVCQRCISSKMIGGKYLRAEIVRKKGANLISDPLFNKGLAFTMTERDRLGIRGLVPPATWVVSFSPPISPSITLKPKCPVCHLKLPKKSSLPKLSSFILIFSLDIDEQKSVIMNEYGTGWAAR